MTRRRGVTVELLDYTKLAKACADHGLAAPSYSTNGLLRRKSDGQPVIISYEGVGPRETRPGMAGLDTEWREWQFLPLAAVEACRTGEEQDLADLIRTFGSRLDVNHLNWYEWAGGEL